MGLTGNGLLTVLMAATEKLSIGEKLEQGLLNTVIGMGTVFVVLIFISILISCFKIIPYLQQKFSKKPEIVEKVEQIVEPAAKPEEDLEDLMEDTELVAVITAAIMASMGDEAPEDGLVVRSMKRVNKKKWQNA